jgi:hypothetical protein
MGLGATPVMRAPAGESQAAGDAARLQLRATPIDINNVLPEAITGGAPLPATSLGARGPTFITASKGGAGIAPVEMVPVGRLAIHASSSVADS